VRVWSCDREPRHALGRMVFRGFDDGAVVSCSRFYVCIVLREAWVRGAGSLCVVCIVGDFLSGFAAAGGDRAGGYLGVG
jgi:hypothetical protein